MNIAIVYITSGGHSGGYKKYLQKIIPLFQLNKQIGRIFLYPHVSALNFLKVSNDKLDITPFKEFFREQKKIKKELLTNAPDVVFIPTARWLNCGPIPTVVMVRNMEPLMYPFQGNSIPESIKNLLRNYVARRSCNRATKIIAVSKFVRDYIIKKWDLDPMKVEVVYHGIDIPAEKQAEESLAEIPDEWKSDFLFTAGAIRAARRLEDIILALSDLKNRGIIKKVVIGGGIDPYTRAYKKKMDKLAEKLGVMDQILWVGHLTPEKMSWCYEHCSAFIMTSRVEACPNIVLEAMAHGCLSISTTAMPMPEFYQDSALYYLQEKPATLSDRMMEAHTMEKERENNLRSMAMARSRDFSWERCAESTIAVLKSTAKIKD
jgi:glycosyltransferase involved in cell wall biosynthesis